MEVNKRLEVLDGMRGIAAFLVIVFHTRYLLYRPPLVPNGYLAVDFFFMLSGLVVAQAYTSRLVGGMVFWEFVKLRSIRLYPLFAIGLLLGIADAVRKSIYDAPGALTLGKIAMAIPPEAVMLPSVVSHHLFVLNGPSWSLFFEMVINVVFALLIFHANVRTLLAIVTVTAGGLFLASLSSGSLDTGFDWDTIHWGAFRVCFPFSVGVLISRLQLHQKLQFPLWFFILPVCVLAATMVLAVSPAYKAIYDALIVLIIYPLIVIIGAACKIPSRFNGTAKFLGDSSYAVYVVHFPLLYMTAFTLRSFNISAFIWLPCFFVGLYVFAWVLDRFYDIPVRRWLTQRTKRKK